MDVNSFQSGLQLENEASSQVNVIWQMGLASLATNNNELILPQAIRSSVGEAGINELKLLLSRELGGSPTTVVDDPRRKVFRIVPILNGQDREAIGNNVRHSSQSSSFTFDSKNLQHQKPRSYGKKSKVPRPPNAFILYRQHYHPILKTNEPNLHNNDISIILVRRWKNETEEVKEHYKTLANEFKRKHAAENPGYQYNPRKPVEKKRRMTARKMERIRAAQTEKEVSYFPSPVSLEIAGQNDHFNISSGHAAGETTLRQAILPEVNSDSELDFDNFSDASFATLEQDDGMIGLSLPTCNPDIQQSLEVQGDTFSGDLTNIFTSDGYQQIFTSLPASVANEHDFLNSLIDWDSIEEDINLTVSASNDSELSAMQASNPAFTGKSGSDAFYTELRNTFSNP